MRLLQNKFATSQCNHRDSQVLGSIKFGINSRFWKLIKNGLCHRLKSLRTLIKEQCKDHTLRNTQHIILFVRESVQKFIAPVISAQGLFWPFWWVPGLGEYQLAPRWYLLVDKSAMHHSPVAIHLLHECTSSSVQFTNDATHKERVLHSKMGLMCRSTWFPTLLIQLRIVQLDVSSESTLSTCKLRWSYNGQFSSMGFNVFRIHWISRRIDLLLAVNIGNHFWSYCNLHPIMSHALFPFSSEMIFPIGNRVLSFGWNTQWFAHMRRRKCNEICWIVIHIIRISPGIMYDYKHNSFR